MAVATCKLYSDLHCEPNTQACALLCTFAATSYSRAPVALLVPSVASASFITCTRVSRDFLFFREFLQFCNTSRCRYYGHT